MSTSIDEQFIEYVVKTIVGNPDAVSIKRTIDEKGVLLELTVDPEDLGRVIGKRGAGAQALRTLLRALGTKNDARYNLKIVDVGGERPPRPEREETDAEPVAENPAKEEPQEDTSAEDVAEAEEDANDDQVFADEQEADESQSNLDKTRRELADLDDLDI
jgi:predicted RNA-binding protein YlqC (UPF0109 family)